MQFADEAVETVAAHFYTSASGIAWSQIDQNSSVALNYKRYAVEALEAAAPLLGPQPVVDREALVALMNMHPIEAFNGSQVVCGCKPIWMTSAEYRAHQADAVLALINGGAK